ncbi:AsnC family transcriptional regulator [Pseudomonas ficuserectae]|nr:AsnC family transcriptional regulator [Pseudomonas ficuserectae]RMS31916.1 Transcriptional regulator, AsnC family [Pseudomonas ficuserectae]RMS32896.1 AsnC family transcriptional regulator [Pseudomonas ficuserectae]
MQLDCQQQRGFFFLNACKSADIEHAFFDQNKKQGQFMQPKLSPIDRKILRLLQHDASLSAAEIAERVELSQSPCWRRIHRLQEDGVIERTVALLSTQKLGLSMTVFVEVKLSGHGRRYLAEFEEAIIGHPEVLECYTMAGGMDFMLKDIASYERFLRDHLLQLPHVHEAHSNIAMSTVKRTTELPLD